MLLQALRYKENSMTLNEAERESTRWNTLDGVSAEVVRILSPDIDPIQDNDNGWDVEVQTVD